MLPLLRSSAHSRIEIAGNQHQVQPGMPAEERLQIGLAALEATRPPEK